MTHLASRSTDIFIPKQSETHIPFLASTPAWVKRGLVQLKSLDYTFDDENTAIPTPKPGRLDARAYRQHILAIKSGGKKGRLTTSEGHYIINTADLSRSPGFRRERHVDKQRKHETQLEHGAMEITDNKSSFVQCTFNMANILMVSSIFLGTFSHSIFWLSWCNLKQRNSPLYRERRESACLVSRMYLKLPAG